MPPLHIEQYRGYRLSAIKDSGKSIKNGKYLLEFKVPFKKHSDTG